VGKGDEGRERAKVKVEKRGRVKCGEKVEVLRVGMVENRK
jgi:hypothetical protein